MAVIGIESSAHTFGVGISDNGKILANSKMMYKITDKGMIPSKVADFHTKNSGRVIRSALESAGLSMRDIDAISYTKGPGIGACLRIGQIAARSLSVAYNLPILPVNHALAHLEITRHISGAKDPIGLYVSGGNSQILGIIDEPYKHYHVYGETFDIGVGNMLDVFARAAKLKPAWGSTVAKTALGGRYIHMPYTVKGMDFTFTGLLTNAIRLLDTESVKDIAFSMQDTAFAMLAEATERVLLLTKRRDLILCGGVAQSDRLRYILNEMCGVHRIHFHAAPNEYNADNGAMIALVGEKMFLSGERGGLAGASTEQQYRVDGVRISW